MVINNGCLTRKSQAKSQASLECISHMATQSNVSYFDFEQKSKLTFLCVLKVLTTNARK